MNKLDEFPPVYFVTLEHDLMRQESIQAQFAAYGIEPTAIRSRVFAESGDAVVGRFVQQMIDVIYQEDSVSGASSGCLVSHLKAIDTCLQSSDSDYAFFCEDDLSLETIQKWNCTWKEAINSLPSDWEALQLLIVRDNFGAN